MSLVNQVLKDLERRHGSQGQVEDLGIENLHHVPVAHVPVKKSNLWVIMAGVLVTLGICTVAGGYLFYQWDKREASVESTTVASLPSQQPAKVSKTITSKPVVAAKAPTAAERVIEPAAKPQIVAPQARPVANTQITSISTSTKPVKISKPAAPDEQSGSMHKRLVPLSNENRAERAYQEGYDLIAAHRYRKAETELRSALALDPGHIKAREMLVGVFISQGRWVEASELLRVGVEISPQHHTFRKLYARSLMQLKRDQQAIEVLSSHKPTVVQDPEHYAILAALYQRQANHAAATRTYSEMLKVRPQMGIWWVGMGISLEAMGDKQQAVAAYQQARKSGSLNGDVARYTDNRLLALDAINYPID